ncbi:MAG TPA: hypothetical protein VFT68_06950 [Lapillicoccus sp.]|nr:hypothetical protein [Lapillicoccus sp.]
MDLLNVLRTLRRFKWTTLTIGALTLGAIAALVFVVPKVYQVDAAYVLVNPNVPSEAELAARPDLAAENRDNPYLRFSSQSMVGQVVATRMSSDEVRRDLLAQGISDDYVVAPSNDFGGAGQIVTVSGVGPTPEAASHATEVIVARMGQELRSMQKVYGAVDRYLITQIPVQAPGEAKRVVSGQLRSVIAVGGVGLVVLFAVISVRQAMEARPKDPPAAAAAPPPPVAEGPPAGPDLATVGAIQAPDPPTTTAPPVEAPVTAPQATGETPVRALRAPAMRLVRNGSRSLHLADDLDAVSSFRTGDAAPPNGHPDPAAEGDLTVPRAVP